MSSQRGHSLITRRHFNKCHHITHLTVKPETSLFRVLMIVVCHDHVPGFQVLQRQQTVSTGTDVLQQQL